MGSLYELMGGDIGLLRFKSLRLCTLCARREEGDSECIIYISSVIRTLHGQLDTILHVSRHAAEETVELQYVRISNTVCVMLG